MNNAQKINEVFAVAASNGMVNLRLRIKDYIIKKAPESGKNKGFLYVTKKQEYLGKIDPSNSFYPSQVSVEDIDQINKIIQSPMEQAVLHGLHTGQCAICGRTLTDPESVALGIGPICAEKIGFLPPSAPIKANKMMPLLEIPDDF